MALPLTLFDPICLAFPSDESLFREAVSDKLDLRYGAIVRQKLWSLTAKNDFRLNYLTVLVYY